MKKVIKSINLAFLQSIVLVLLRIAIGWHFLYEGVAKLYSPSWSSYNFLSISRWIFADFFHWIAETPEVLKIADFLNIWGLILIGLALFFWCFYTVGCGFRSFAFITLLHCQPTVYRNGFWCYN